MYSTLSSTQVDGSNMTSLRGTLSDKPIKLMPFGLSWPIFGFLEAASKKLTASDSELRFLLVMSQAEEATPDTAEARYTLLRSLHDQLQGLPIHFSIETAVGPLTETAVAYASKCQAEEIFLVDSTQFENELSHNLEKDAPCKITTLPLN